MKTCRIPVKKSLKCQTISNQRGIALIFVTVSMGVILAMSGLALDIGHALRNKTYLENALDSAALSAAQTLMLTNDTIQATTDAQTTFNYNLTTEMANANLNMVVEFSDTLVPFNPGTAPPQFVRARVDSFTMPTWLIHVLPGVSNTLTVSGSAVAAPIPVSDCVPIAPMVMCAGVDPITGTFDNDCSDGTCYGYSFDGGQEIILKTGAPGGNHQWAVGKGNFQLLELGCGPGGACVRDCIASGGCTACAAPGDSLPTKPGDTVGPTAQGFNTRFGVYQGPVSQLDYPPDLVTTSPMTYANYDTQLKLPNWNYQPRSASNPLGGIAERRILRVPIADCSTTVNGQGDVHILGKGCFFMTRKASHQGNSQTIYGELIAECNGTGGDIVQNPIPTNGGSQLYKIILYDDPDKVDS